MNRKLIAVSHEEIFASFNDETGPRTSQEIKFNLRDCVDNDEKPIGKHILYECPTQLGRICGVPCHVEGGSRQEKSWQFDGNEHAPTLTPSIQCLRDDCRWHGFITNGELVTV